MAKLRASRSEIMSNARLKLYPSACCLQVSNAIIFREPGWEPCKRTYDVPPKGKGSDPERSILVSRARAKSAVRDIALLNSFGFFFTWTLDPKKINRHDADEVKRAVMNCLKNLVKRKGFSYVLVPELHKDGAIHFHGLCNLGSMCIERAVNPHTNKPMSTDRGQPIFNMPDWKFGYSTCIPIDDNYTRTCNYLVKYLTKDAVVGAQKIFGKWYFSSRNLARKPAIQLVSDVSFDEFREENPDCPVIDLYRDVKLSSAWIGGASL